MVLDLKVKGWALHRQVLTVGNGVRQKEKGGS